MATYSSSKSREYYISLVLTPKSYSITNNSTPVDYVFKLHSGAYNFAAHSSTGSLKINGESIAITSKQYTIGTYSSLTLKSGTITIPHNSDGTKTISFSASFDVTSKASYTPAVTLSISGSLTLPTIPRASSFILSGSTQTGSDITVGITPASTSFTHRVRWRIGSGSWTTEASAAKTSTTFQVPHSAFPNSTSGTIMVGVQTYNGSTAIGSEQTKTRELTVPTSIVPSFTTVTHSEAENSVITAAIGAYVQNKSKLKLAITGATAGSGSSIKSYKITVDGQVANAKEGTTGVIKSSGSVNIVGMVTDSRGRSISKTVPITVLPYQNPTLASISLIRSNSAGVQDPFGVSATLKITAKVSSLDGKNTATYRVRSKVAPSGTWITRTNTTAIGVDKTATHTYGDCIVTNEYQFEVLITDKLGSQTIMNDLLFLSSGGVPFFTGYDGIASSVGKIPTHGKTYDLEIGNKGMRVDGVLIDKNGKEVLGLDVTTENVFIPRGSCRDANDATQVGMYSLDANSTNIPYQYGVLNVYKRYSDYTNYLFQMLISSSSSVWVRAKWNDVWTDWKRLLREGDTISSDVIQTDIPTTTLASSSRTWHDMPTGYYYVVDGQDLGYPYNYALINHRVKGNLVFQIIEGDTNQALKKRRFNTTQSMNWST